MQHEEHCELVVQFELDPACTCGAHERAENLRLKRQLGEAADERDRLRARVEVLERALKPFADFARFDSSNETLSGALAYSYKGKLYELTGAHLHAAAEALAAGGKQDGNG
jgi:hypothetical protein